MQTQSCSYDMLWHSMHVSEWHVQLFWGMPEEARPQRGRKGRLSYTIEHENGCKIEVLLKGRAFRITRAGRNAEGLCRVFSRVGLIQKVKIYVLRMSWWSQANYITLFVLPNRHNRDSAAIYQTSKVSKVNLQEFFMSFHLANSVLGVMTFQKHGSISRSKVAGMKSLEL